MDYCDDVVRIIFGRFNWLLFVIFLLINDVWHHNTLNIYCGAVEADLPFVATAFVQTGSELHYFSNVENHENLVDGTPLKRDDENAQLLNNQLRFAPTDLSFGDLSVGALQQQTVRIRNPTASTVRFDAISGSTVHFHCSFPKDKTVNPGEETTFDVIFLPRYEGTIENVLFVHSSLGTFTYTVRGRGTTSAYRLRPVVGIRVPLNGTLISPIHIHNPFSTTLHITEMYTSGGDVHLELPYHAPENEHKASLWDIAPFESKTVMNAKLLAAHERNTTVYIAIKTKRRELENWEGNTSTRQMEFKKANDLLILPIQVEITKKRGIYATVDILDFGLVKAGDKSVELKLDIVSTVESGISIESVFVDRNGEPSGVYMEFASKPPISVKCGARHQPGAPKAIAKLTFDSKLLRHHKTNSQLIKYSGWIIAESKGGVYNVSVPYVARVYFGSLVARRVETAFHSAALPPLSRSVSVTNDLPFDIVIWNVSLEANALRYFKAKLIAHTVTIIAGETKPIIQLKYVSKLENGFLSHVIVHSNISMFKLPIHIFDGKLRITLYSLEQSKFHFGLLDVGQYRSIRFAITNDNPVAVVIKKFRRALPSMTVLKLIGVERGNRTVLNQLKSQNSRTDPWQEGADFILDGQSFAVFEYGLRVPADRSVVKDTLFIETDYETRSFPVVYAIGKGTILPIPERLVYNDCFPGRITSLSLKVVSTFKEDMRVLRLSTLSYDSQIFFEAEEPEPVIKSGSVSSISRVHLAPGANCSDDCYVGVPLHTADGQWFTYGIKLPQNLAEIDSYLYNRLRRKYLALKAEGRTTLNTTITIDTDKVKNLPVPLSANFVWPKLLTRSTVHFPLTAVGNFTIVNLTLTNPSSRPIVVQLLPLVIYPDAEMLIEFIRNELESPLIDPVEMNETLMFSLRDTELFTLKPDSPVPKLREQLEKVLGIQVPKFTLSMLLQPGMNVRIRVGFLPSDYVLRSSLLLIRNNLTILEPVVLYGRGARMDMKVEGRAARTRNPLLLEILPHHLTDCSNPKRLTHKLFTTLTVKRSFTILNSGEVAFTVVGMSINNVPCENRGFRILNCQSFSLAPNQTHILDVAYTPDFLISWNEAALQFYMHMNGTSWLFPIGASVPPHMLSKCHAALPRPPFENLMYYSCVSALMFCLICVVACAYLEGDRTVTCALRQQHVQIRRVFDLNTLEMRTVQDIKFNKNENFKSSPFRRRVLYYSEDSNIFVRAFWQTANSILWLFSFIWQFRSDEPTIIPKRSKRQTRSLVKCGAETSSAVSNSSERTSSELSVEMIGNGSSSNKRTINKTYNSSGPIRQNGSSRSPQSVDGHRPLKEAKSNSTEDPSPQAVVKVLKNNCCSDQRSDQKIRKNVEASISAENNSKKLKKFDAFNGVSRNVQSNPRSPFLANSEVQTTPTIERNPDWSSYAEERSYPDQTPEWVDGPSISNDGNVDEDFTALVDASQRLFKSEFNEKKKQNLKANSQYRPPPVTIVRPIQAQPKRNTRKKHEQISHNNAFALSQGFSSSSEEIRAHKQHAPFRMNDSRISDAKWPDGTRPSAFIEQLQRERKTAELRYLMSFKQSQDDQCEVWPGFNLNSPTLPENFLDLDNEVHDRNESVWRLPTTTASKHSSTNSSTELLTESIKAFRFNPNAQPFISSSNAHSNPSNSRAPSNDSANADQPSSPSPSANNDFGTHIDDPLGLSGSLFGRGPANIWANGPNASVNTLINGENFDSAAIYWAEQLLADDDDDRNGNGIRNWSRN